MNNYATVNNTLPPPPPNNKKGREKRGKKENEKEKKNSFRLLWIEIWKNTIVSYDIHAMQKSVHISLQFFFEGKRAEKKNVSVQSHLTLQYMYMYICIKNALRIYFFQNPLFQNIAATKLAIL